jgi:ABC-type sugar transport system ATPase subunit
VSFEIPTGEYGVLMGKTGSGKTTILEAICGLKRVSEGRIVLMGRDVTALKPASRGIGFVAQDGALFPMMTVYDHLGFSLAIRKRPRGEIETRVHELADLLGLGTLLKRKPEGLSGGEKQRVALGRALAFHPQVLCLDEPLSALDEDTKDEMYDLLLSVQKATGVTVLHVTHSRQAASRLANRKFFLREGVVSLMEGPAPSGPRGRKSVGMNAHAGGVV